MQRLIVLALFSAVVLAAVPFVIASGQESRTLAQQNEALFDQLRKVHNLTEAQIEALRKIFARSGYIGQGNPAITRHPVTAEECEAKLKKLGVSYESARFNRICGGKYMAPLYNPATQQPEDAAVCIDQFEFPNIPCVYPVVWVRAWEAAEICQVLGKRLCDAHEWEGACAGSLEKPDYRFDLARGQSPEAAIRLMRQAHNNKYGPGKSWSYGPEYKTGICAGSSHKSPD